jgi:hypothetical protein
MVHVTGALPQYIPSPPISSFHVGPLDIRFYALGYIIGITLAVLVTRRRWRALGGDPDLVSDMYIAIIMTLAGLAWFAVAQRRPGRPVTVSPVLTASAADEAVAREDDHESVTTPRNDE